MANTQNQEHQTYIQRRNEALGKFLKIETKTNKIIMTVLGIILYPLAIPFLFGWYILPLFGITTTKRSIFIFLFILYWLVTSWALAESEMQQLRNIDLVGGLLIVLIALVKMFVATLSTLLIFYLIFYWIPRGIFNSIKNSAERSKKIKEDMKTKGIRQIARFAHVYGLSIAENVICKISDCEDKYNFEANGVNFNLDKSKITDVCIKTDTEIQHQSVSSVGGAIAGGVLFGPLGAIIGGRAKTRKVKTTTQYLIFTYISNEEIKFICFDISSSSWAAKEMVMAYNLNKKVFESKTIDL